MMNHARWNQGLSRVVIRKSLVKVWCNVAKLDFSDEEPDWPAPFQWAHRFLREWWTDLRAKYVSARTESWNCFTTNVVIWDPFQSSKNLMDLRFFDLMNSFFHSAKNTSFTCVHPCQANQHLACFGMLDPERCFCSVFCRCLGCCKPEPFVINELMTSKQLISQNHDKLIHNTSE